MSPHEEASSPPTRVPHGSCPLAPSSLGSGVFCSAAPSQGPLWGRNHCVRGRGFQGSVAVGLTRGRAVGGTSGPLFRQLPFPGVSPQPPQLPLSVTRRLGEIRRDRGRGSVTSPLQVRTQCVHILAAVFERTACGARTARRPTERRVGQ